MRNAFILTILSCLTVLTSSGQYKLLLKGQPSPFDTAVAIHIDRYRVETHKLRLADTLIRELIFENTSRLHERQMNDSLSVARMFVMRELTQSNIRKDVTIATLNTNYNKLFHEATLPKRWYEDPWKVGPAGFCLGVVLTTILVTAFH